MWLDVIRATLGLFGTAASMWGAYLLAKSEEPRRSVVNDSEAAA